MGFNLSDYGNLGLPGWVSFLEVMNFKFVLEFVQEYVDESFFRGDFTVIGLTGNV